MMTEVADAGTPPDDRIVACFKAGAELPDDVRDWLREFRRQHEIFAVWDQDAPEKFWPEFFVQAVRRFDADKTSLNAHLAATFRRRRPYIAWTRSLLERPEASWLPEERREVGEWKGSPEDLRVATLLACGEVEAPEAKEWFDSFNARAMSHCRCFGHSFEDVEDFVSAFWVYAYQTGLFSKYSIAGGQLFSFAFQAFINEFSDKGKRRADTRDKERPDDAVEALASTMRPPDEVALASEIGTRVRACLAILGMAVRQPGWLLRQVKLMNVSYDELAKNAYRGAVSANTLRQRVFHARNRFEELWASIDEASAAAPQPKTGTSKSGVDMNENDAVRRLRAEDEPPLHPSDEELVGIAYGDLKEVDRRRVDAHVATCSECREQVSRLRRAATHFGTPVGKAQLDRLWSSFREAAQRFRADAESGETSRFAVAASRAHERYLRSASQRDGAVVSWADLDDDRKISTYTQLVYAEHLLKTEGLGVRDAADLNGPLLNMEETLGPDRLRRLAEKEHERFVAERVFQDWHPGPNRDAASKTSPYLVPWKDLPQEIQDLDVDAVRALPVAFRDIGREVYRLADRVDPHAPARKT